MLKARWEILAARRRPVQTSATARLRRQRKNDPFRYIDQLQDVVRLINNRVNRVTKLAPADVTQAHTQYLINLTEQAEAKLRRSPRYKTGDTVRIAKKDIPFRKGYKAQYTEEVFTITRVTSHTPPSYALKATATGERIYGQFYEPELIAYGDRVQS